MLSTNGIGLPVLNVFRMFGMMDGRRVAMDSSSDVGLEAIQTAGVRARPDVAALATNKGGKLCMLVWHHHDDDVPGPAAEIELSLSHLPDSDGPVLVRRFRVDHEHGNAFEAWKRIGSPQRPTPEQYALLERASQLALLDSPEWVQPQGGKLGLKFSLPRQGVSLLVLEARRAN